MGAFATIASRLQAMQAAHAVRHGFPWLIGATIGHQLACQREDRTMGIDLLVAFALPLSGSTVRNWYAGHRLMLGQLPLFERHCEHAMA
jgi:hypothetical protein